MDMLVHLTALTEMFLERYGLSLKHFNIDPDSLVFARYDGAPEGAETFARISGLVSAAIPVSLQAGKGLNRSSYWLKITGTKGELEVNLGTEELPGFMRFTPNDQSEESVVIYNTSGDIGYKGTVQKVVSATAVPGIVSQTERDFRFDATALSVRVLDQARVMFGHKYYQIPFAQNPAELVAEPGRAMSIEDRMRELLLSADNFLAELGSRLESQPHYTFNGKRIAIDQYYTLTSDGGVLGYINPNSSKRSFDLQMVSQQQVDSSFIDLATAVAGKHGWGISQLTQA